VIKNKEPNQRPPCHHPIRLISGSTDLDEGIQLLITTDGKLQMAGGDTLHLQILGGVTGQLQHLSGEVLCGCWWCGSMDEVWVIGSVGCRELGKLSCDLNWKAPNCPGVAALNNGRSDPPSTASPRLLPRMAAVYTAAVAPTRPLAVTRVCGGRAGGRKFEFEGRC